MKAIVSIIIINYKTLKLTSNCIDSIFKTIKSCNYEVIVVDNSSKDGSAEGLRQNYGDKIRIIESDENLGFGRANNLGAKYANGEYLFLLNSDTILENDPFVYFIKAYMNLPKVAFLGSFLKNGEGKISSSGGKVYSIKKDLGRAFGRWIGKSYPIEVKPSEKPVQVEFVIGADIFVRKSIFFNLKGFDPHIFMYLEEVKLCALALSKGYRNYIIPGPEILHLEKQSSKSQFARVHYTASLMYCIREQTNSFKFRLFQFAYFLAKIPLVFSLHSFADNWEYISSIYGYKKYLVK